MVTSASALEITISNPQEVEINKSFDVTIAADTTETHDVKIFVYQDEYSNIISEIKKNGDWSNPFYYSKEAFPDEKIFQLMVLQAPGTRELCARLRKTGGSSFEQTCTNITVVETDAPQENKEEEKETKQEEDKEEEKEKDQETKEDNIQQAPTTHPSPLPTPAPITGQIILNPTQDQPPAEGVFITQKEKQRTYLIYSFTGITLIIVLLLSLRKL